MGRADRSEHAEVLSRAHVVVRGRVQGVFFRASASEQARARKLAGWVRNAPDGSVEAVFQGPRADVEHLIAWCHDGPPAARVTSVDVSWQEPTMDEPSFDLRW